MFYAARAALKSVGIETNSHAGLINQFGLHFIKSGKLQSEYGRLLAQAFQARQVGDYDVMISPTLVDAERIISNAEQFTAAIKQLLSESHESE